MVKSVADVLKKELKDNDVEEGTVVTFNIKRNRTTYTYAALYVAKKWWVTGTGTLLATWYNYSDFFRTLIEFNANEIKVATEWEKVKDTVEEDLETSLYGELKNGKVIFSYK